MNQFTLIFAMLLLTACGEELDIRRTGKRQQASDSEGASNYNKDRSGLPAAPPPVDDSPVEQDKTPIPSPEPEAVAPAPSAPPTPEPAPVKICHELAGRVALDGDLGRMGDAIKAALNGPNLENHELFGQTWLVKKAAVRSANCQVTIEGEIMGILSPYTDPYRWAEFHDRTFYTFTFADGKIAAQNIAIQRRRSVAKFVSPFVSLIGAFIGVPITPKSFEDFVAKIDAMDDASFDQASTKIAARIGSEAFKRSKK